MSANRVSALGSAAFILVFYRSSSTPLSAFSRSIQGDLLLINVFRTIYSKRQSHIARQMAGYSCEAYSGRCPCHNFSDNYLILCSMSPTRRCINDHLPLLEPVLKAFKRTQVSTARALEILGSQYLLLVYSLQMVLCRDYYGKGENLVNSAHSHQNYFTEPLECLRE